MTMRLWSVSKPQVKCSRQVRRSWFTSVCCLYEGTVLTVIYAPEKNNSDLAWCLHLNFRNSLRWRMALILSDDSDFVCFQKTPRGLYLGQCLVTFSLNLEVLYVAIMSTG